MREHYKKRENMRRAENVLEAQVFCNEYWLHVTSLSEFADCDNSSIYHITCWCGLFGASVVLVPNFSQREQNDIKMISSLLSFFVTLCE